MSTEIPKDSFWRPKTGESYMVRADVVGPKSVFFRIVGDEKTFYTKDKSWFTTRYQMVSREVKR